MNMKQQGMERWLAPKNENIIGLMQPFLQEEIVLSTDKFIPFFEKLKQASPGKDQVKSMVEAIASGNEKSLQRLIPEVTKKLKLIDKLVSQVLSAYQESVKAYPTLYFKRHLSMDALSLSQTATVFMHKGQALIRALDLYKAGSPRDLADKIKEYWEIYEKYVEATGRALKSLNEAERLFVARPAGQDRSFYSLSKKLQQKFGPLPSNIPDEEKSEKWQASTTLRGQLLVCERLIRQKKIEEITQDFIDLYQNLILSFLKSSLHVKEMDQQALRRVVLLIKDISVQKHLQLKPQFESLVNKLQ